MLKQHLLCTLCGSLCARAHIDWFLHVPGSGNLQLVIACVTAETGVYVSLCYGSCLGIRKSLLNLKCICVM